MLPETEFKFDLNCFSLVGKECNRFNSNTGHIPLVLLEKLAQSLVQNLLKRCPRTKRLILTFQLEPTFEDFSFFLGHKKCVCMRVITAQCKVWHVSRDSYLAWDHSELLAALSRWGNVKHWLFGPWWTGLPSQVSFYSASSRSLSRFLPSTLTQCKTCKQSKLADYIHFCSS